MVVKHPFMFRPDDANADFTAQHRLMGGADGMKRKNKQDEVGRRTRTKWRGAPDGLEGLQRLRHGSSCS